MKLSKWRLDNSTDRTDVGRLELRVLRGERQSTLDTTITQLVDFGISKGFTDVQIHDKVEELFATFAIEIFRYLQIGSPSLSDAIDNDLSLAWLNTDASGKTIRERLIERLA